MPKSVLVNKNFSIQDLLMLAGVTAWVFLNRYYVLSSDPLLAWPITDSIAHPERYSSADLLVQAGITGNFLLYRLLAYLPILKDNFPLRDFLIYTPIYFLTLFAWRKVFTELGANRSVATMSILLLILSDNKLSLNWAHVVPAYFVSATSVQFLQVFGLLCFLKNRRNLALSITAASGYFHPASALSFGSVYIAIIVYDAYKNSSWRDLEPIFLFIVIFLPNVLMIALNSQGSFAASKEYFKTFEKYQPQAYLGDHFRMGYAYTLAVIALVYRYHTTICSGLSRQRELFLFIAIGLVGSCVWIINLYTLKNLQCIQSFFLMRIFSLIHPLLIFLIVTTAVSLYATSKSLLDRVIVVLFLLTPLHYFSPTISLLIVVTCTFFVLEISWWPLLLGTLMTIYFGLLVTLNDSTLSEMIGNIGNVGKGIVGNELNWFQVGVLIISVPLTLWLPFLGDRPTSLAKGHQNRLYIIFICVIAIISFRSAYKKIGKIDFNVRNSFNFNSSDYWGVRTSDRSYAELLDWVRQSPYKLFSVPPYDDRFLSFRFLSGKGVYIFHRDIAQLMYSPNYYLEGVHRLLEVAGNSPDLPKAFMSGEMQRRNGEYEANCRKLIVNRQFNAIIFERKRFVVAECKNNTPVFENDKYVVFSTAIQAH